MDGKGHGRLAPRAGGVAKAPPRARIEARELLEAEGSVAPRREVAGQTYRDVVEVVHTARESGIVTRTWFAAGVGVVEIVAGASSSRGTTVQVHSTLRGYSLGDEAE